MHARLPHILASSSPCHVIVYNIPSFPDHYHKMGSSSVDNPESSPLSRPPSRSRSRHRSRRHSRSRSRSHSLHPRPRPEDIHQFTSPSRSRFSSRNRGHSTFSIPSTSHHHDGSFSQGPEYPSYYSHRRSSSVLEQHPSLASQHSFPALLSSHLQPVPPHVPAAYHDIEISIRLEKVERENMEIRQALAKISVQLEQLKSATTTNAVPSGADTVRARLKQAVLEAVNPIESLLPGEELGFDCVRTQEAFPNLKFFTDRQWTTWRNKNQQATRIGDERVRGKKKSSQGENHTAQFIERPDGTTADGDYVNNARKFCREFIALVQNAGYPLPPSWGQADLWLQDLFYTALRRKFTLFQLCHNNSKGNTLMNNAFYEGFVRKVSKAKKSAGRAVDLSDAPCTIKTADDDLADSTLLDLATQSLSSKRVAGEDMVDEPPAKRICTDGEHAEQPRSDVVVSTSTPIASTSKTSAKGKERATPNLLSLVALSSTGLRLEPRAAPLTTPPSSTVPMSASSSLSDVALPGSTSSPTSTVSPELSSTSTPELLSTSTPELSPTSTRAQELLPTSAVAPSPSSAECLSPSPSTPAPKSPPASASVVMSAPPTETATEAPTAAASTKQPRPRPRRKPDAWPPPEQQEGAKWAYARKWYTESGGTQEAFEAHYKVLSPAAKRKITRDYGSSQPTVRHLLRASCLY
ncbi:hypothetical protein LXA43DRAFT_1015365 [Ganoderma leucocontextum]|nr:hypothetical protein LXA43DRAFT_1015365 [Ganoderma leucocontextum]